MCRSEPRFSQIAATADDWAGLTPRQRKACTVAHVIMAAGGGADHVDVPDDVAAGPGRGSEGGRV